MNSHWKYLVIGYDTNRVVLMKTYCATESARDSAVDETRRREGISSVEVMA